MQTSQAEGKRKGQKHLDAPLILDSSVMGADGLKNGEVMLVTGF